MNHRYKNMQREIAKVTKQKTDCNVNVSGIKQRGCIDGLIDGETRPRRYKLVLEILHGQSLGDFWCC